MVATLTKASIWAIRFFQWSFAVILIAVTSYLIHQFRELDDGISSHSPRELVVPLIFSVLATIFTTIAILGLFFLNHKLQAVSAFLDFILWVGYLASAGLNRRNYHVRGTRNGLWNKLVGARVRAGLDPRRLRNDGLVKLLAALVVIQLILFFITMLLQLLAAKQYRDRRATAPPAAAGGTYHEKSSPFNRFSRHSAASGGTAAGAPPLRHDDAYAPGQTATAAHSAV